MMTQMLVTDDNTWVMVSKDDRTQVVVTDYVNTGGRGDDKEKETC